MSSSVRFRRPRRIALWIIQIALAGVFFLAGMSKLLSATEMVSLFDGIGFGQWFRYVTGLIEAGGAIALLVPSFAAFGALALAATMVGAIAAQILVVGQSPLPPAVLLLAAATVVWARRHELLRREKGETGA